MMKMKETPQETRVRKRMLPGAITLHGFIGKDKRSLNTIIAADEQELEMLGYTADDIADRMQYFTDVSFSTFDGSITIDNCYKLETEVVRGKLPCPYAHGGLYRKAITKLTNLENNVCISWTSLNIHLIKEHHFFEGKGSAYRLEPSVLVKALF